MYTVACHSALRAGDKLTMAQMEFVIREMESIPNPYACVHGRPTVMTITPEELDKKFKKKWVLDLTHDLLAPFFYSFISHFPLIILIKR